MAQSVQGGPEQDPAYVGELVVRGIQTEQFFILTDEVHSELIRRRAQDFNAFLEGRLNATLEDGQAN